MRSESGATSSCCGPLIFSCRLLAIHELFDRLRDLAMVCFEREVPGFVETDVGIRQVAAKCFGAGNHEVRIVLSPYGQQSGTMGPKIILKDGVHADIASVVEEEV